MKQTFLSNAISDISSYIQLTDTKVSIIMAAVEVYDKAYDYLVEQAAGHPWLNIFTVQNIVPQVGYCDRLKTALFERLARNDLSAEQRADFTKIKDWLDFKCK